MAVGWNCLASSSASRAARRDQHLEALVAGEVDQDARIMRVVLDDQQDGVAGLDDRAGRPAICSIARSGAAACERRACDRDAASGAAATRRYASGRTYLSGR